MRQFIQVLYVVKNYLLNVNCLSLDPGHIYVSDEIYYFCYCPGLEGNILEKFHELTEYFVRETDYEQKEAVYLAYELHKASMEENYMRWSGYWRKRRMKWRVYSRRKKQDMICRRN